MLSVHPQDIQHQRHQRQHPYHQPHHHHHHHQATSSSAHPRPMPHREPESPDGLPSMAGSSPPPTSKNPQDAAVAQALEIARESPDGASDPTVSKILEHSLSHIWGKVKAQPGSYVMSRDEFAVFNFFQHRFTGNKDAVAARKRYWDNARA
ncbi:Uncharacterized protein TPAR_06157 [Tolypocladium paradoxum]|uniref:Peptide-N4-(N-acetyl-beta-glucosaminyl)asparagine amidase A n=1 Tax=Tolypocladium paradoxum TaxID=94208 RepID=A0A2S4KTZ5_9HYPO|nr:Uncharacterized protein TPAR_06157 [Tolypocladium paradoxum]